MNTQRSALAFGDDVAFLRAIAVCAAERGPISINRETARDMVAALDRISASQPQSAGYAGERLIDCLRNSLMGTDEAADNWTFAGMEDAFFRWPVVERELRRVLTRLSTTPDLCPRTVEAAARVCDERAELAADLSLGDLQQANTASQLAQRIRSLATPKPDASEPPAPCIHEWRYSGTDYHGSRKGENAYSCLKCRKIAYEDEIDATDGSAK